MLFPFSLLIHFHLYVYAFPMGRLLEHHTLHTRVLPLTFICLKKKTGPRKKRNRIIFKGDTFSTSAQKENRRQHQADKGGLQIIKSSPEVRSQIHLLQKTT